VRTRAWAVCGVATISIRLPHISRRDRQQVLKANYGKAENFDTMDDKLESQEEVAAR
jgi:hypothetical protein